MSEHLTRARLLLQHDRADEALGELTRHLAQDPQDAEGLALAAICHAHADRYDDAEASARAAVGAAPDWSYPHFVLGNVLLDRGQPKGALASGQEATRLDPEDPDHYALVAAALGSVHKWKGMLESADRALGLDPAHSRALSLRSLALRQLGEVDEAGRGIDVALAERPDDPDVHDAAGWNALHQGDPQRALRHFREALRLDPEDGSARAGLVEALKAKNPLYRPILWWMIFSSRLTGGGGLLLAFGLMFGVRAIGKAGEAVGGWGAVAGTVLVVAYVIAVWTTWVGVPLFDLLLWLRRDTRPVLEEHDRFVAVSVGATILAAPIALVGLLVLGQPVAGILAGLAFLFVAIPVSGGLSLPNRKARALGAAVALGCAGLAIAGTMFAALDGLGSASTASASAGDPDEAEAPIALVLLAFSIIAAKLSTWLLLGLGFVRERR